MKYIMFAAAIAGATPAFSADLILNGDFEADDVHSLTITGWHINSDDGGINMANGGGYGDCCGGTGSPGTLANQFVVFGSGETGTGGIVSQSFKTTASLYTVWFDAGAFGNDQTITGSAIDSVTNLVLGSFSVTRPGSTDFDAMFATSGFSFVSGGNAVKLSFTAAGSDGSSADAFLDNVHVLGTAVPEPSSWALMLGGFGLIGGAMRSRRTARASFG